MHCLQCRSLACYPGTGMTDSLTRRWLLSHGGALLALCSMGCGRDPSLPSGDSSGTQNQDTDPASDSGSEGFDPCSAEAGSEFDGWVAVDLSEHAALAEVGGWAVMTLEGRSVLIAQVQDDCFIALSAICTHEGCTVEFRSSRVVCPCHGATFSQDGSVQGGPTSIPLDRFAAARSGDQIWVELS
jgi:cytochrome b6-f complex iron-sulfur subunit